MRVVSILASCLVLLSCAVPQLRAQTSIVAVMSPESIVIGADSKETTPDGSMGGSFCKIGTTGGVFWAHSLYARDTGLNFSADVAAHKAMETKGSLAERVAIFEKMIKPQLKRNIEIRTANTNYELFRIGVGRKPILDILFAAFENEKPKMLFRRFEAHRVGKQIEIESVPLLSPEIRPEKPAILEFGHHETIDRMASDEKASLFLNLGLEGAVRFLVEREIAACPRFVGPSVAIVRLDAHGSRWISIGACSQTPEPPADTRVAPNPDTRCDEAQ